MLAGAEPFSHTGSAEAGVLLCHGFTGTPQSLRPWGEYLAGHGLTVRCPLLPGHGTTWQECNRTTWPDWYGAVRTGSVDFCQCGLRSSRMPVCASIAATTYGPEDTGAPP